MAVVLPILLPLVGSGVAVVLPILLPLVITIVRLLIMAVIKIGSGFGTTTANTSANRYHYEKLVKSSISIFDKNIFTSAKTTANSRKIWR